MTATKRLRGRPAKPSRFLRGSIQVTAEQAAWLNARAQASGVESVAAVVRMLVQQAMAAERAEQAQAV